MIVELSTKKNVYNLGALFHADSFFSGLGFGLIYLPAIVSVGYYFEERRAFATGLAVCGSGLGAFIFNPFSKYLIDEYGWRGAILIEAAIILNCVLCGALFRPLKHVRRRNDSEVKEFLSKSMKDVIEMELLVTADNGNAGGDIANGHPLTLSSSSQELNGDFNKTETEVVVNTTEALFRSDGALHRFHTNKNGTRPISPLAIEQKPPQLRRLLSAEQPQQHSRHHHHLTPGIT